MSGEARRLRNGTHRAGNIYWADVEPGNGDDDGQVGYVRDGALARAMVDAYNAAADRTATDEESRARWRSDVLAAKYPADLYPDGPPARA